MPTVVEVKQQKKAKRKALKDAEDHGSRQPAEESEQRAKSKLLQQRWAIVDPEDLPMWMPDRIKSKLARSEIK
eukprot:5506221-Amphidinium_carterae.2